MTCNLSVHENNPDMYEAVVSPFLKLIIKGQNIQFYPSLFFCIIAEYQDLRRKAHCLP